ncbi:MAG: hypothetical protein F6K22_02470 [Okeania sp. SIO2F4]|uniref:hypothetical protein n=1 Tax=Okeania sp. SIO2F4 TaxID=2607790 RepID=UPI00142B226E|nr:hypothetical protein [Okeania sp. SIO2F4]NES01788.1 hypothetical protein [Okeania sp. SIO2F4]
MKQSKELLNIYIASIDVTIFYSDTSYCFDDCLEENKYISIDDTSKILTKYTGIDTVMFNVATILKFNDLQLLPLEEALKLWGMRLKSSQLASICLDILSDMLIQLHKNIHYSQELSAYKNHLIELGIENSKLEKELIHWRTLFKLPTKQ